MAAVVVIHVLLVTTLLHPSSAAIATTAEPDDWNFLPPQLHVLRDVIPQDACAEIVRVSNAIGWSDRPDSIGHYKLPSQDIYVYDRKQVLTPKLQELIEPFYDRMTQFVRHMKEKDEDTYEDEWGQTPPRIHWVFIRKYGVEPGSMRDRLGGHTDSNRYTLSIPLNEAGADFEGGHIWFQRPGSTYGNLEPEIDGLGDRNSSTHATPWLRAGDAVMYNKRLSHGITPVTRGSRYSLAVFFDMPNEGLEQDTTNDQRVTVTFANRQLSDDTRRLELWWTDGNRNRKHAVAAPWAHGENVPQQTFVGHEFMVVDATNGKDEDLHSFRILQERRVYEWPPPTARVGREL
eukprot:TRINITY_DN26009_c0_g1_i1.p1 TRINITY_DN26009_c0_g1~~TRINITY_DN26009_c0_g1_i1.p1  ORF type:complete len:346 (-),score=25.28 TRINITY_DN26009_c0_g1_i1:238-1275(-)